jgi:uracil-DNA glycosylase family 4
MSAPQPTLSTMEADRLPADSVEQVAADIVACCACPRLVAWRRQVAADKRAAFRDEEYWGRPVPGFGDPEARVLVAGLAPAAHGGNRTGRVFTGDRSGDWLFSALFRAGYANQPTSTHRHDGLVLSGCYISAAVRCAPPANKPTGEERDRCAPFLGREIDLLTDLRVIVVLGQFALDACCRLLGVRPRPRFGHLAEATVDPGGRSRPLTLLCSFHPSQQNTFTGKLTEAMFDAVFARARQLEMAG